MLAERGSEDAEWEMRLVRADSSGVAIEVDCIDAILSSFPALQPLPLISLCLSVCLSFSSPSLFLIFFLPSLTCAYGMRNVKLVNVERNLRIDADALG